MVIDCHGHYTTAPKELQVFRDAQIAALKDPSVAIPAGAIKVSDDQLRESVQPQLKFQSDRGTDVTIFSPRASAMAHHIGDARTSLDWSRHCNDLIHRVCELFPQNFNFNLAAATPGDHVSLLYTVWWQLHRNSNSSNGLSFTTLLQDSWLFKDRYLLIAGTAATLLGLFAGRRNKRLRTPLLACALMATGYGFYLTRSALLDFYIASGATSRDFWQTAPADVLKAKIADLTELSDADAVEADFIDLGEARAFEVVTGEGECAS